MGLEDEIAKRKALCYKLEKSGQIKRAKYEWRDLYDYVNTSLDYAATKSQKEERLRFMEGVEKRLQKLERGDYNRNVASRYLYRDPEIMFYEPQEIARSLKSIGIEGFKDVVGLREAKDAIEDEVIYNIKYPDKTEYYDIGGSSGILFYGPPGCGKSLLARVAAKECKAIVGVLDCPNIRDERYGSGPNIVRSFFETARKKPKPVIVLGDELDAIGGIRNDTTHRADRDTMATILSELDGIHDNSGIVPIGTTNDLPNLDPAFVRPGRFNHHVYVGPPGEQEREKIFELCTRKKPIDKGVNFRLLAQKTRERGGVYSCAGIWNICRSAALKARRRDIKGAGKQKIVMHDFDEAIRSNKPDISSKQMMLYRKLNGGAYI